MQFAGGHGCREAWEWQWERSRASWRGAYLTWLRALLSPPLGSPGGKSRHTHQLVVGCDREIRGVDSESGGPGPRARLLGLWVAWGGQEAGLWKGSSLRKLLPGKQSSVCAKGTGVGSALRGFQPQSPPPAEPPPLEGRAGALRALLGEAPPLGRGPGLHPSPTSEKQYSWVGPEPRWGWAGLGRGGPRPGASSAAWNEEGARAPGRQLGFRAPLCLFKAVGP